MRIIIFIFLYNITITLSAQDRRLCNTTEASNLWFSKHPELKKAFDQRQEMLLKADKASFANNYSRTQAAATLTIPVVFHILHTGGSENISDAQIEDAVKILSRDFQKLNADTSAVVPAFKNIIGNTGIEFVLAKIDPNGNCTNGIIRHWDVNTNWTGAFNEYAYSWPNNQYLNFYVVKTIDSGAAGYTYLPGSGIPNDMDNIVILSSYVGSIGTANVTVSRALTHEVGHWLNLPHVWGGTNQPGVSCGDDGVSDTPITQGYTSCALNNSQICTSGVQENVQNYMDYAYCSTMFTLGQSNQMQNCMAAAISGRNNLSTPANLALTGITTTTSNCIPFVQVASLSAAQVCKGSTLTINSYTSNYAPTSYFWSATNGATIANPNAANAAITFPNAGSTTVTCLASTINGGTSASIIINVTNAGTAQAMPYAESFEAGIPANWSITNVNSGSGTWSLTSNAAKTGLNSFFLNGATSSPGDVDILKMPTLDVLNNPNDTLTFKLAYARKSTTHFDNFKVEASKNCGGTWGLLYNPAASNMANGSGGVDSNFFVPTLSQWKHINLSNYPNWSNYSNSANVMIRFSFTQDVTKGFGNNLYIDDINFSGASLVGINEISKNIQLSLYPNPTKNEATLHFILSDAAFIKVNVTDVLGRNVLTPFENQFNYGEQSISLNSNNQLKKGIYFVTLSLNGTKLSKKLIIE